MNNNLPLHLNRQYLNNSGFTLVEVLVASVILFAVIASVSMLFSGAFISSEKASNQMKISGSIPSIVSQVKEEIQLKSKGPSTNLSDSSSSWGVNYTWKATLLRHKSAPERLDTDSGNLITPPNKYKLWSVELDVEFNGITRSYAFYELGWTND